MLSESQHALSMIRSAGQNFDSVAQWMQQWAAWGMEPKKFPQPSSFPPTYMSDKERILSKLRSWRDAESLKPESCVDAIDQVILLVESA